MKSQLGDATCLAGDAARTGAPFPGGGYTPAAGEGDVRPPPPCDDDEEEMRSECDEELWGGGTLCFPGEGDLVWSCPERGETCDGGVYFGATRAVNCCGPPGRRDV